MRAHCGQGHDEPVSQLIEAALRHGVDAERGRVIDEIGEDGGPRAASSRSWPHAEALKALSEESNRGADHSALLAAILSRLRTVYCEDRLEGGWIDHVDAEDRPISDMMPASTLYHMAFAIETVAKNFPAA